MIDGVNLSFLPNCIFYNKLHFFIINSLKNLSSLLLIQTQIFIYNNISMASNIPPKSRETAKQTFYTKGEIDKEIKPFGVKSHIAEPSTALTVVQRNPSHYEEINIKPKAPYIRTRGYTPGLYSGMCDPVLKEHQLVNGITSLSEAKLLKKKEYSE